MDKSPTSNFKESPVHDAPALLTRFIRRRALCRIRRSHRPFTLDGFRYCKMCYQSIDTETGEAIGYVKKDEDKRRHG